MKNWTEKFIHGAYHELSDPRFDSDNETLFLFSETSIKVIGPIELPIQYVPEDPSPGTGRPGINITAHVLQAPR